MIVTALDFSVFLIFSTFQIVRTNDLNPHPKNLSDVSSHLGLLIGNTFTNDSSVNIPPVVSPSHHRNPHTPLPRTKNTKLPIQRTTLEVVKTSYSTNKFSTSTNLGWQEYTVAHKQNDSVSSNSSENNNNNTIDYRNLTLSSSTSSTETTASSLNPTSTFSFNKKANYTDEPIPLKSLATTKSITTKHGLTTINEIQKTSTRSTDIPESTAAKFYPSTASKLTTIKQGSATKSTGKDVSTSVEKYTVKSTTKANSPLLTKTKYKSTSSTTGPTTHVQTTHKAIPSTFNLGVTKGLTSSIDIKPSKVLDTNESKESTIPLVTERISTQTSTKKVQPLLNTTLENRNTTNSVINTSSEYPRTTTKDTLTSTSSSARNSFKAVDFQTTSHNTNSTSPVSTQGQTSDVNTSLNSYKPDSDKYWPVAMAITIGVPAVIVIGVTISVINRKRNLEKAHSTLLNGYITPPSEYEV